MIHVILLLVTQFSVLNAQGILCFGDSLTHGFRHNLPDHPYSLRLTISLQKYYILQKGGILPLVIEKGTNGQTTNKMIRVLPALLKTYLPDLVIILGGTNDLLQRKTNVSELFQNIRTLHEIVHQYSISHILNVPLILVTIPPAGLLDARSESYRLDINNHIVHANRSMPFLYVCDLAKHPHFLSVNITSPYWLNDLIHFTALGYDMLGELLFDVINKNKLIR